MQTQPILGIDEFTITLLPDKDIDIRIWDKAAFQQVRFVAEIMEMDTIFRGSLTQMSDSKLQGYTHCYNMGPRDYYVAIAYHEAHPVMGVCVRFSAKAWSIYQYRYHAIYNQAITLPQLLRQISENVNWVVRLSRIDLTADYFDSDISLSQLYAGLVNGTLAVQNDEGSQRVKSITFTGRNDNVETLYIGSRSTNTKSFLRIYDKRMEQIRTNGYRRAEAVKCKSWIRFEAVYKGQYAHLISETMLREDMPEQDLHAYIAQLITQKYRFYDCGTDECTEYTKALIDIAVGSRMPRLYAPSPRDNALNQHIRHIKHGSGLFPTLYKIRCLYGEEAEDVFWDYLRSCYQDMTWLSCSMQKEILLWIKRHEHLKDGKLEDSF